MNAEMIRTFALVLLFATTAAAADSRAISGTVTTSDGQPLAGMTVALTRLPIEDAEDVTATTTSRADGSFRFEGLDAARYGVAAADATRCADGVEVDLTNAAQQEARITSGIPCRVVRGTATGAAGAHVIVGRFLDTGAAIFSTAVRDGRFAISIPAGGVAVAQALAPEHASTETEITDSGDTTLVLERRYAAAPDAARKWIRANAIPLTTVVAGNGFKDMEPLRALVGNVRIVSLGEATHGTREFFQFKHRMLEFLVTKMGFSLFAIEASEPDAIAVDDYVTTGRGDPATALRNLGFWTWNTEEVLDMIRWMRAWNADPAHKTKLRFYGFDMQNPAAAKQRLETWLTAHGVDAGDRLAQLAPLLRPPQKPPTAEEQKAVLDAIAQLDARVDAVTPHDAAWQEAKQMVELLRQALTRVMRTDRGARDRAMAANIKWIADRHPGERMVVWAHNGHVSAETLPFSPGGTMGVHMRRAFGNELFIIGFAFDHGAFRAVKPGTGLMVHTVPPLDESTFDRALALNGPPLFVLDLRKARGEVREWLSSPLPTRAPGAIYDEARPKASVARIHPLQSYDAIFFVNETTASRPVRIPMPKPLAQPSNLSFEDALSGWGVSPAAADGGYVGKPRTEGCRSGACAELSHEPRPTQGAGSLAQRIDATPFRGKKVRFRAWVRTALRGEGSSGRLWLRVDRPDGSIGFFDNMATRDPGPLDDWTQLEIVGDVAADAEAINYGALLVGDGMLAIDDVTLEVMP